MRLYRAATAEEAEAIVRDGFPSERVEWEDIEGEATGDHIEVCVFTSEPEPGSPSLSIEVPEIGARRWLLRGDEDETGREYALAVDVANRYRDTLEVSGAEGSEVD